MPVDEAVGEDQTAGQHLTHTVDPALERWDQIEDVAGQAETAVYGRVEKSGRAAGEKRKGVEDQKERATKEDEREDAHQHEERDPSQHAARPRPRMALALRPEQFDQEPGRTHIAAEGSSDEQRTQQHGYGQQKLPLEHPVDQGVDGD